MDMYLPDIPKVEVCFSPSQYDLYRNDFDIAVVIDVLRATSAIATALEYGVEKMIPVSTVEEARELQKQGLIAAAERNGAIVKGFDLGNSPIGYMDPGLKGKTVAVEEGVVDDYLLSLALKDAGLNRDDVVIKGMPTDQAATAFAAGQVDAVGAFPPYTGTAMQREGARVIASSKEYPGAIPDLLTVSGDLIKERPDDVQKIVKTWWDVREFMEKYPEKSEAIMAKRAGIPTEEYEQYKDGTRFFSIEENLEAFSTGEGMKFMPFAAESMADFMVSVGFIPEKPDMTKLFDDSFIKKVAAS